MNCKKMQYFCYFSACGRMCFDYTEKDLRATKPGAQTISGGIFGPKLFRPM
jgi:hypothetical protein